MLNPDRTAAEKWSDLDWNVASSTTRSLFEPRSPIDQNELFSGRIGQVTDLLEVVYEKGAHAIIYGERGVGKSSLANVIRENVPPVVANIKFVKDNCRPEDGFFHLWSKMLYGFTYEDTPISDILKDEDRHFIVPKILETLDRSHQYVFIFDEFDRVSSDGTKAAMADTIKHFSDYPQNITIIVVGVGFSVTELFGAHPSIERCCKQIQMPRMSKHEISQIIIGRSDKIGIQVSTSLIDQLVELCQGFPGYGHLLGREALLAAIDRKSRVVHTTDTESAINRSVESAQESMKRMYQKATYSAKENIYRHVLLACAMTKKNDMGLFSPTDVREVLSGILKRRVEIGNFARHLAAFCDVDRGPILRKTGKPKRFQYQFIDAPIQPYIIMAGKRDGLI